MKKILPLHKPVIQHNPANAYLLSIIGNEPDEYAWIMNNFVNMRYNTHTHYDDFFRNDMWYNCYYITENRFIQEFVNQLFDNCFEMVKKLIDMGFCIYLYLNTRYIPLYNQEKDWWHNAMVYGYDEEDGIIYLADFFDGKSFSTGTCTIEEFRMSYPYPENKEGFYYDLWSRAFRKKNNYKFRFNLKELYIKLNDYVNGVDINASHYFNFDSNDMEDLEFDHVEGGFDYVYGNRVYDAMCEDLLKGGLEVKALHLILEFESLMCKRIRFLEENGYIKRESGLYEESEILYKEAEVIRNLFIKYKLAVSLNEASKKRICDKLMFLKEHEKDFINELLIVIKEQNEDIF